MTDPIAARIKLDLDQSDRIMRAATAMGLRSGLIDARLARPCAHCPALDELDHDDDCPTQRRRTS